MCYGLVGYPLPVALHGQIEEYGAHYMIRIRIGVHHRTQ